MALHLLRNVRAFPLVAAFFLGLFYTLILRPAQGVVMKFPSLDNAGSVTYRDRNGVCFVSDAKAVDCDANEARISPYPLQ